MPWTSGWAPVAMLVRQTGVTDGNVVDPARVDAGLGEEGKRRQPPLLDAALEHAGVRPSMTARTSLRSDTDVERAALRLEQHLGHVAEILAVDLERGRARRRSTRAASMSCA